MHYFDKYLFWNAPIAITKHDLYWTCCSAQMRSPIGVNVLLLPRSCCGFRHYPPPDAGTVLRSPPDPPPPAGFVFSGSFQVLEMKSPPAPCGTGGGAISWMKRFRNPCQARRFRASRLCDQRLLQRKADPPKRSTLQKSLDIGSPPFNC